MQENNSGCFFLNRLQCISDIIPETNRLSLCTIKLGKKNFDLGKMFLYVILGSSQRLYKPKLVAWRSGGTLVFDR